MRCKRAKELDEDYKVILADLANCINLVDKSHQAGNCSVELHSLDIGGYLLDCLMDLNLHILGCRLLCHDIGQSCNSLKETLATSYGAVVPRSSCAVVTHEENVGTKCICTILIYNVKRVNNVALGFTHLVAV